MWLEPPLSKPLQGVLCGSDKLSVRPSVLLAPLLLAALLCVGLAAAVHSEGDRGRAWVWIDERGVTQLTDDASRAPKGVQHSERLGGVGGLWDGPLGAAAEARRVPRGQAQARTERLVRGAVLDLRRGETARAAVVLQSVLRDHPAHPEAHWYLAVLDRHRGRYESAGRHLEAFLASAGERLSPWRESARRRLRELADERRLADETLAGAADDYLERASEHFLIHYDVQLGHARSDYAVTVMRYLEEARRDVGERLGTFPAERMGVVFYGKAAYNRAHGHRFSFQTVGFFDGRIHVVSAAHPAGELRALLFHEYVHALYREQTGGDRPYWLNEGLAELSERASRRQPGLTRSERSLLRRRIDADAWIPLRRLAPSFSGLDDDDARAAYLEATAAAAWIEDQTSRAQRGAILSQLGAGLADDAAFAATLELDTEQIDAAVRRWIRSEFPATAEATSASPSAAPPGRGPRGGD